MASSISAGAQRLYARREWHAGDMDAISVAWSICIMREEGERDGTRDGAEGGPGGSQRQRRRGRLRRGTGRLVNPRRSTSSPCRRTRPCRTSIMHTLPAVRSAPCRASERRARPPCRAIHKSAVIYHGVTFRRPYTCIALPPLCFRNALHFILESYSATYPLNFLPYAHEYLHVN